MQKDNHESNRRDFFRISQKVHLDYRVVDQGTADEEEAESVFNDTGTADLINELQRIERENAKTLRLLTEKNPLLGDYLQALNSKIELVARHYTAKIEASLSKSTVVNINLSEDGLAFHSNRMFSKGTVIATRVIFLPSYTPLHSFATVVRCEKASDTQSSYLVAAHFYRVSERVRQEFSRQILRAQVALKKNRLEHRDRVKKGASHD